MRTRLLNLVHLVRRTYLHGRGTPARYSLKRFVMLTGFIPVFAALQILHRIAFFADDILFPRYRDVAIEKPIFMLGVPRSGTTLLHRLIALDESRVTTTTLWELIFAPSITERYVIHHLARIDRVVGAPFASLIGFIEKRALSELDDVHPTALSAPEEDYIALMPIMSCFLLILPFPFYDELWYLSRFDNEASEAERTRVMSFYRSIIQRHLYWHGPEKRYLSKNPSFSAMVACLDEEFPDAQFICNLRTPEKVYPSLLNSMTEGAKMFDNDLQGVTYWHALSDMLEYYYRHLIEVIDTLPESRAAYVTMEKLVGDSETIVKGLYGQFDWDLNEDYAANLRNETNRARSFRSKHHYTLDQFGLTPHDLQTKFRDHYVRFGWSLDQPADDKGNRERMAS